MRTVNEYLIAFPFKGDYFQVKIDANYLANCFITHGADYDFQYDDEMFPSPTIKIYETRFEKYINYEIEIKIDGTLNIAYPTDMENEDLIGSYVERNIPYLLLKVSNKESKNDIYNVTDD